MQKRVIFKWLRILFLIVLFGCAGSQPKVYKDPFYLYRLGVLHFQEGHLQEAEKNLLESIRLNPKNAPALNALGLTYLTMGKYEEAKLYFEKTIQVMPSYSDAYNNLGVTYLQIGNLEKAEFYFNKAREDTVYSMMPNVWLNLGIVREKQERYEEAIAFFTEAIKRKENYPIAYLHRGKSYQNLQKYNEALQDLKKYNEMLKDDPEGLYEMGKCLVSLKNVEEGKVYLEKAYLLGPQTEAGKKAKKLMEILP